MTVLVISSTANRLGLRVGEIKKPASSRAITQ
jgi:hypothetical protein